MRRSGFEGPLAVIITAVLGSIATNTANLSAGNSEMVKALTFFLSYVFVLYIIVSVVVRLDSIEVLVKTLVVGGTVVALGAVVEARSGFNVFNQLPRFFPILRPIADTADLTRFGTSKSRVFASAQHPIALSAAIVMLLPLALYLARRYRQRRWYLCAVVMGMGCVSTVSRTGVVMFLVAILVFFWLRPKEARRMWPALLPALLAIHFVLPGTLGALKQSFFPKGGLVAEQQYGAGTGGHGRLAAVSAAVPMWQQQPFFGRGYGAPVSIWGTENLDDQWLATLLTTGAVGFIGWLWFFVRALRRIGREAKSDRTDRGWLLTSLGASIAAFAAGMMTFDAFAFIQVTFLLFIFVGLASALLVGQTPPKAVD
jgi:hypothetical protein